MNPDTATFRLLADVTLVIHAGFVLFVIVGQVLIWIGWAQGWRWTRGPIFRFAHLTGIGFVVMEAWFGIPCPLTVWEDELRRQAGVEGYGTRFIGYWVGRFLFYSAPEWVFTLIYSIFALIVAATFIAYPPKRRDRLPGDRTI